MYGLRFYSFVNLAKEANANIKVAKALNISPHQLSYVTHSGPGEGLIIYDNVTLPFVDKFPTDIELYRIMTTKLSEVVENKS